MISAGYRNPLYDGAPVPTSPAPSTLYPTDPQIIPATAPPPKLTMPARGMGSWQADQTMAVGTGAVGARLLIGWLIGLLIGGLIANSQARRDARALDQSPHRWAAEAVRWCAASSPAAAHRSSALGGSATCSVVVRSRVSARPCGSRCRVPPARRDVGHRPASNISRFCGPGRS